VPGIEIADGPTVAGRPAVLVTGRQHAWETGGSWTSVGLVEWLVSDDPDARWLRSHARVVVVPVLDVDHVATGDGGKHAAPRDHNRDWTDAPHWPEVAAMQARALALARDGGIAVFLDLHNPASSATRQTFYVQAPPYIGDTAAVREEQFLALARAQFGEIKRNDGSPLRAEDLPVWKRISTPWIYLHGDARTIAFTVETPWNTTQGTQDGYREAGRKLGRTVALYLQSHGGR
jgi:hypothetical protein